MGINEEDKIQEKLYFIEIDDESSYEECESDDSEDDPSFDIENEVRYSFSTLSLAKKSKSRVTNVTEEGSEDLDVADLDVPELGEEDQKSFEALQKKIEAGQLEKLNVDQCKVYLRKYGLRLTGNKETLLRRIREYLEVIDGGGEKKYPASSFVLNCKGDACTGDVVMFEQNVYNTFNIASRSANGPPCGTRIVAGRIVKESYGAAKQQHTFTIEVLWSKGVKPLPPLHPLLIKGRNLYRLKTIRQKWKNEDERQKILIEKHSRGDLARSTRQVRKNETRKILKAKWEPKKEKPKSKKEENKVNMSSQSLPISSVPLQTEPRREPTSLCPNIQLPSELIDQRQYFTTIPPSISFQDQNRGQSMKWVPLQYQNNGFGVKTVHSQHHFQRPQMNEHYNPVMVPLQYQNNGFGVKTVHSQHHFQKPQSHVMNEHYNPVMVSPRMPLTNMNGFRQTRDSHSFQQRPTNVQNCNLFQNKSFERKQVCVYYPRGRCYYEDRCKYLHENMENHTDIS